MTGALILAMATLARAPMTPMVGMVEAADGTPVAGAELVLTAPTPGESPVVARGKAGEGGRFRFDRPSGLAAARLPLSPTLWVVAPGHRVALVKFADKVPGPDEPVRVILGPPARVEILVRGPDGRPIAGARVNVQRITSEPMPVPSPVGGLAERATGPDGVATLDAFAPEEVGSVDILADRFGNQPRRIDPDAPGPKVVDLQQVGSLLGRVVADPDDIGGIRGWRIRVWTRQARGSSAPIAMSGYGEATTDVEGRFSLPEIAPGVISLAAIPPEGSQFLADPGDLPSVVAGRPNVLEIPIRKGVKVAGLIRERGTNRPIAGAALTVFRPRKLGTVYLKTDTEGRFSCWTLAGKSRVWMSEAPDGFANDRVAQNRDVEVAADAAGVEVPPIELERAAPPLRGEVRDEEGRPVAGARVLAASQAPKNAFQAQIRADEQGRFAIDHLAPGTRVTLSARSGQGMSKGPVTAVAGQEMAAVVVVERQEMVAVAGRVIGTDGKPIAGISITLLEQDTTPGRISGARQVHLVGRAPVRTGPDGTFRTAAELPRDLRKYRILVLTPGYDREQSDWGEPGEGDVVTLPDLVLRKQKGLRTVAGRVVDVAGSPIAGATVSQRGDGPTWTQAIADAEGRFLIPGFYDGPALIFAEKAGYRFGGAVVGAGSEAVTIRLAVADGPPISRAGPGPSLPRDEGRALGLALLEPILPDALPEATLALARLDPDRVLEMVENRVVPEPEGVLAAIVVAQAETNPDAAAETIGADRDPAAQARLWLALADATPDGPGPVRAGRLDLALDAARRVENPHARAGLLGEIAGRWLDRGDLARATPILREGQALDASRPLDPGISSTSVPEAFGEVLAAIDPPAARAIIARTGQPGSAWPESVRRHLGEAAVRMAAFRPEEAERLLAENPGGPNPGDRETLIVRVARSMARADLPRARKLLASIADRAHSRPGRKDALAPYGLGLIASDRAADDPAGARALLDEAFAGVVELSTDARGQTSPPAAIALAALLPAVERADPDRLVERLWRAAACRPGRDPMSRLDDVSLESAFAGLITPYDFAMAAAMAAHTFEAIPILLARQDSRGYDGGRSTRALAVHDPRAVADLIRNLPASTRRPRAVEFGRARPAPATTLRIAVADVLGHPPRDRSRAIVGAPGSLYLFKIAPDQP